MIRWKSIYYKQIWTLISFWCLIRRTCTLTVDNQLVSARNDCFERVALEAMIPFEKTFKTEDTNSLRMCKEKCLQEGDKCQSMSFGVHRRGNGTCQLSKEKYKVGSRPNGVIFDPDFDLYARKTNCFDLTNNNVPDHSDHLQQANGYGSVLAPPTSPVLLPSRPSDGTPIFLVQSTPSVTTTLQDETTRYVSPTTGYEAPTTIFTQHPPTTYEPSTQNVSPTTAKNGDRLYFSQEMNPLYKYPTLYEPNYPAPNQEVYIPGGYAANAQEVEDRYRPTSYDGNVRPLPPTNYHGPPKPIFGLGYGNGYSYSQPESYNPTTMRPQDSGYSSNSQRPTNTNRDNIRPLGYDNENRDPNRLPSYDNANRDRDPLRPAGYDNTTPSSYYYLRPEDRPNNRPNNDFNSQSPYGPRPSSEQNPPPPYEPRPENSNSSPPPPYGPPRPPPQQPGGNFMDFTNRPDAPYGTSRPSTYGFNNGSSFDNNMRRNGTATSRPGGYNDDKHINTYFNPNDYIVGNKKRPGSYEGSERPDFNRQPMMGKNIKVKVT